jgi:hypothetical protein
MSRATSRASQHRRRHGTHRTPRSRLHLLAQKALAVLALIVLLLALLAWAVWRVLLWFEGHPQAGTALWISALALGLLAAAGLFYWTYRLPPPGLRGRHARRADLARYYDQRGTLHDLQTMDPLAFERCVGQLFEREGYRVQYTERTGDGGVDIILRRPGRGWSRREGDLALVQCKRYASQHTVGSPELQQFSGALRHHFAHEGYFVTTSFFTPAAKAWAEQEGIHLIDGLDLLRWRTHLARRERVRWLLSPFRARDAWENTPDDNLPAEDDLPGDTVDSSLC